MARAHARVRTRKTDNPRRGQWVVLPDNSPYWNIDFTLYGERHCRTTGLTDRRAAEKLAWEFRDEKIDEHVRVHGRRGVPTRRRDAPLLAAMDTFWLEKGHAEVARRVTWSRMHTLTDILGERTRLSQVDDGAVVRLITRLERLDLYGDPTKGKLGEDEVNSHIKLLRRFMRHFKNTHKFYLPDMPDWPTHTLADIARTREVQPGEMDGLAGTYRPDLWPAVDFLFQSAMRLTNGVELTWKQVDLRLGKILIRVKASNPGRRRKRRDPEKRRVFKEIPISPEILEILRGQWGKHPTAVFTFQSQKNRVCPRTGRTLVRGAHYPLTAGHFKAYWRKVRDALGIEDLHTHDLRRTRGCLMLRATGDITKVQRLLTHQHIATTSTHYAHVTTDDLAVAMARTKAFEAMLRRRQAPEWMLAQPPAGLVHELAHEPEADKAIPATRPAGYGRSDTTRSGSYPAASVFQHGDPPDFINHSEDEVFRVGSATFLASTTIGSVSGDVLNRGEGQRKSRSVHEAPSVGHSRSDAENVLLRRSTALAHFEACLTDPGFVASYVAAMDRCLGKGQWPVKLEP